MIQNPEYFLYTIEENKYLVPTGNAHAKRNSILELKGIAKQIWDFIYEKKSVNETVDAMAEYYEPQNVEEYYEIQADVNHTLAHFLKAGAALESNDMLHDGENIVADDLIVEDMGEDYSLKFPIFSEFQQMAFAKKVDLTDFSMDEIITYKKEKLLATRIPFSYAAAKAGRTFIHSVSVLYEGKVWLYSAAAGIGKSTHAKLWEENGTATIINGDLNLLGLQDGQVMVYGTPWCGTSECYNLSTYPLGGIVFLTRDDHDHVEEISYSEKVIGLISRTVSPLWDKEMLVRQLEIMEQIATNTKVCKLYCTPKKHAYEVMKEYIDCQ